MTERTRPMAEYGATAWGWAWLRLAEPTRVTRPNPSLPRARSLNRTALADLTLGPGRATATVAGQPVTLLVPPWPPETLALVEKLLAEQQDLAPGDLSDALADQLQAQGIALAPTPEEVGTECGCRDRREYCTHVLATVYALVQAVDERPVLAVELRGAAVSAAGDADWVPLTEIPVAEFYG